MFAAYYHAVRRPVSWWPGGCATPQLYFVLGGGVVCHLGVHPSPRMREAVTWTTRDFASPENGAQSGSLSTIPLIARIAARTEAVASPALKASSATAAAFKCPTTASFSVS